MNLVSYDLQKNMEQNIIIIYRFLSEFTFFYKKHGIWTSSVMFLTFYYYFGAQVS